MTSAPLHTLMMKARSAGRKVANLVSGKDGKAIAVKPGAVSGLRIHLGAGPINVQGWVNIDAREAPHISGSGLSEAHTAGRRGSPHSSQARAGLRCGQGTPAGLPWGRPGSGEVMDGAMQQAAQPVRQAIAGGSDMAECLTITVC